MKIIPIQSHYELTTTSVARCLRLEKDDPLNTDPIVFAFTSLNKPVEIDGITYVPGLDLTNIVSQSGLQVDNLEVTILPDPEDTPLVADLVAGYWDFAKFTIFEFNFRNPGAGVNLLARGWTGVAKMNRGAWTIEFRSLKQALQQPLTQVTSKTCRYRLGSTSMPDGLCFVDLAPFTYDGVVAGATSNREFTSDISQPDDWFKEGRVLFVSGDNAGYERKVKTFLGGEFVMATPFPFAIQAGDEFSAIAGCQRRLIDCIEKFDNVLNFGGEPHIKGTDALTADPEVNVE